ncbi:solute carrier family 13 member 2 [Eurytemora carolleeae]|uniref:solute carrier family 13 member 2 n=1 Tax=Eurytemora carolleeae TaxID=1294199 RepID=UPI000C77ECB2|nr:solute carrier family 13 member 2 [Eurytemora carolleeae]|eukprot:XP_023326559.1 solute carrier family 13 member 2-like [Eurytemora affinis]
MPDEKKKVFIVQPTSNGRFTVIPHNTEEEPKYPVGEYIAVFWRTWLVVLAPFILSPIILTSYGDPETDEAMKCAYVILLMATYWMTEALPLPITSMIPVVALPLLGLMSTGEVAINYLNSTNYMFLGGLIMAIAVEHSGLHNRVALRIIMRVGTSQARLMLGFMLTTMFLSMWISNTATTAMMLPIVDAVAEAINTKAEKEDKSPREDGDKESNHASEEEDEFNDDDYDLPFNQRTFTSINQLSMNQRTLQSLQNQMTVTSINSLNPANDPDSMVAFLPNVRRNTMERMPSTEDQRTRFRRRNDMERQRKNSRLESISLLSKEEIKELQEGQENGSHVIQVTVNEEALDSKEETERNFLLMGIAYAANIGGTGVITGSPPNLVVPDTLNQKFGPNTGLTFASWMAFSIPIMLINTILAWLWLQRVQKWYLKGKDAGRTKEQEDRAMDVITKKYKQLGKMSLHEFQVFILFLILLILWFFQSPKFMTGWGDLFRVKTAKGSKVSVGAATPAILMAIFLFILPQNYEFWPFAPMNRSLQNSPSLITWRLIETKMCWGVIFLLGGGFALASASQSSGLSALLVHQLEKLNLSSLPNWLTITIICFLTVTITNVASNTATANVLVPILAEMAVTMCINPIYMTLPAGIVCSYAFALPVATAPNAIVFGHSTMKTMDMMKAGFFMNLVCVLTISFAINTYAIPLFALDAFPDWASARLANASMCSSGTGNLTSL